MRTHVRLFGMVILMLGITIFLNSCGVKESTKRGDSMEYFRVEFFKIIDEDKAFAALTELARKGEKMEDPKQALPGEEYVGSAEYKNGKVNINVSDPELKKALTSPFTTVGGERHGNRFVSKFVVLEPGTSEHLGAIAKELKGYRGDIYFEEEGKE